MTIDEQKRKQAEKKFAEAVGVLSSDSTDFHYIGTPSITSNKKAEVCLDGFFTVEVLQSICDALWEFEKQPQ